MNFKNLRLYSCSHGLVGEVGKGFANAGSFGQIIANHYKLTFINNSVPGASNYYIFKKLYDDLDKITNEDLVFVQWSHTDRAWTHSEHTVMPHQKFKIAKLYYKNFYTELQEANKVLGYNFMLNSLIKNFVFNFFDGESFFQTHSPNTFELIHKLPNYLNVNSVMINEELYPHLFQCSHLNEKGHNILSKKYIDKLDTLYYNNNITTKE